MSKLKSNSKAPSYANIVKELKRRNIEFHINQRKKEVLK